MKRCGSRSYPTFNLTAFEAVVKDLREISPDLILHGGDLADSGANPCEIVDRVRALGWQGVVGNTDQMLFLPESLEGFIGTAEAVRPLLGNLKEMAAWTREQLGDDRISWLRALPLVQLHAACALVHASPESPWRAPMPEVPDASLRAIYGDLNQPVAVYAHIHRPYIRELGDLTVANTGSVSLSHDGDSRAAYLVIDDGKPKIRRVMYDLDREIATLRTCGLPHFGWVARTLKSGSFQRP